MGQGGGEQQAKALFRLRAAAQQEADVLDEAQVEHAVGLVQDHDLGETQVEDMLLEEIDDASWCADEDIHALGQMLALLVVIGATVGQAETQPRMPAEHLRIAVDLHGQFAGRCQHQGTRLGGLAFRVGRVLEQVRIEGHQEGGGLAGAGLRLARHIMASEGDGQGLGLDRGAGRKARIFNALHQLLGQVEVLETYVTQMII